MKCILRLPIILLLIGFSLASCQASKIELYPQADAAISQLFGGAGDNNGKSETLPVSNIVSFGGASDTLMRFDLSRIPSGAKITSATLHLRRGGNVTDGDLNQGATCIFTQADPSVAWDENTVTWNNAPARGTSSLFTFSVPGPVWKVDYSSAELTSWVQAAVSDPKLARAGWRVYASPDANTGVWFFSNDASFPFYSTRLEIEYDGEPVQKAYKNRLSLSDFTVIKSGDPFIGERDGRIGVRVSAPQVVELSYPKLLTGDYTVTCRLEAQFRKAWNFLEPTKAGLLLRKAAPTPEALPHMPIFIGNAASWADTQNYTVEGWVEENRDTVPLVALHDKKQCEFYYRITKKGNQITTSFSREGYDWLDVAQKNVEGYDNAYCAVAVFAPGKSPTEGVMILEAFEVNSLTGAAK